MFAIPFKPARAASAMLIALALAGGAKANRTLSSADELSRAVRYGDLNLATDAGAEAFRLRAHRAIAEMYDGEHSGDLAVQFSVEQAKRMALTRADAQVAAIVGRARAGGAS